MNNARIITEAKADSVLPLRDNHPNAHREVDHVFLDAETEAVEGLKVLESESQDRNHGGKAPRAVRGVAVPETLLAVDAWSSLQCLVYVRRERTVNGYKTSCEKVYSLPSLPPEDVAYIATSMGIENRLRCSIAGCFREYETRIHLPNAIENMAVLGRFALGGHNLRTDFSLRLSNTDFRCLSDSDEL